MLNSVATDRLKSGRGGEGAIKLSNIARLLPCSLLSEVRASSHEQTRCRRSDSSKHRLISVEGTV